MSRESLSADIVVVGGGLVGAALVNALKPLPLREGGVKTGMLYLIFADRDAAGPGTLRLAGIIRKAVRSECRAATADPV